MIDEIAYTIHSFCKTSIDYFEREQSSSTIADY